MLLPANEATPLQFRMDALNVFNHPVFSFIPNNGGGSGTGGNSSGGGDSGSGSNGSGNGGDGSGSGGSGSGSGSNGGAVATTA